MRARAPRLAPSSRWIASLAWLVLASSGCYVAHQRDVGTDARVPPTVDAAAPVDAGPLDAGRLCGCPGDPAAEVCRLPEMCCPVTLSCEDPSRFRCTGSTRRCD